MATLSWNEIRQRAIAFSREWADATSERAEAQTFWNEFFEVFGIRRRTVASFEEPVKNIKESYSRIDLFWKGRLLAEHKSAGRDLTKAQSQAFGYIQELASQNRHEEIPQYVIVSDFQRFALYDLEAEDAAPVEFSLADLHKNIRHLTFIPGYKVHRLREEDPANLKAAALMANLHDALEAGGYAGSDLERLLVRLLFCLFAEDTGIFESAQFQTWLGNHTCADGSDLGIHLARLFDVLNTAPEERQSTLEEDLAAFEYVNGGLFAERLRFADFNREMRDCLKAATQFDWSRISPALFGSLFQGVMEPKERRQIGAHYTSERDILKVIRPLFIDQLWTDFKKAKKKSRPELVRFHERLSQLKFFDPACGCGNFLVIAYRELRLLELEILKALYQTKTGELQQEFALPDDVNKLSKLDVDQFYGIEIEEWPARIAETALWLMDHQMNILLSETFGQLYKRLPLCKTPHICCANALCLDWNELLPASDCSYVFGNPPFVGAKFQDAEQKADLQAVAGKVKNIGLLDYVTSWYFKASGYINESVRCAFVSTNSVSQGEQVGVLWSELFARGIKIHFAHRTFAWTSEARGAAHVHVVIIGFGLGDVSQKRIFDYHDIKGDPVEQKVSNINPYLVESHDTVVNNRSKPLCEIPEIVFGNMPNDGGNLILSTNEKIELLKKKPDANPYIRLFLGAHEFINGEERWCLWLKNASPAEFRNIPEIMKRVEAVREHRTKSSREATRKLAETPALFGEIRQPSTLYLAIPKTSSERRTYIPIAFLDSPVITNTELFMLADATIFHFGILTSQMHMAWVSQICGRLKSDFRYSAKLVYNNFPWPQNVTDKQRAEVEQKAQAVLDARQKHLNDGATLADLYDPLCTPADLLKAHHALDHAVDRCYRPQPFTTERQRIEHLFTLYKKLTAPLAPSKSKQK